MKLSQTTIPQQTRTTPADVAGWAHALTRLHARIAARFARPEPRRRALAYLQGILSSVERKNGWQLAEQAREATPYGMQRLLSQAIWDADGVRDDLRTMVLEQLGDHEAIVVLDETSFPKRGRKSVGVKRQYCGTVGHLHNCQVGVFLSYVSAKGHSLIDRELYLPLKWREDAARCREAGIPESVRFQTKPELARLMIERLYQAKVPIRWVVADSVYGSNEALRAWLEAHEYSYVMAVRCDDPIRFQTPLGGKLAEVRDLERFVLHEDDWQRLSMGIGTKGPRLFDWATAPILHQGEQDGQHFLLIRRRVDDPSEKTYYLVFAPKGTTLQEMVWAIGARWDIEEDFQSSKDLGLDQYEVRSWLGWYRHITLVMLAHAFLRVICSQQQASVCLTSRTIATLETPCALPAPFVAPLTVAEVRHLLAHLIWPLPSHANRVLAWSWWRRCHRGRACYHHSKRRREKG